jgi:hypothetical protein
MVSIKESSGNFGDGIGVQETLNQCFGENVIDHRGRRSDGLIGGGAALEKGKGCELSVALGLEDFVTRWGVVVTVHLSKRGFRETSGQLPKNISRKVSATNKSI